MRNLDQIHGVVLAAVKDLFSAFAGVRVINVDVADDTDADGNAILRINVVFEGDPNKIDARRLSGVVRELRPKLEEIDETAFPLLSFIEKSDMRTRKRASA